MPGLVPGIHVLTVLRQRKTWMAGTSPAMTEKYTRGSSKPSRLPVLRIDRDRGRGGAVFDAEFGIDLLEVLVDGARA
jgi:hypothetical protein